MAQLQVEMLGITVAQVAHIGKLGGDKCCGILEGLHDMTVRAARSDHARMLCYLEGERHVVLGLGAGGEGPCIHL